MLIRRIKKIYSDFLCNFFIVSGLLSIVVSFSGFLLIGNDSYTLAERENAERFALFIGLWAPTLLVLALLVAVKSKK